MASTPTEYFERLIQQFSVDRILLGLDPWHWPPGQVRQIQARSGDLAIPLEQFSI
jgi:hypothetical protein